MDCVMRALYKIHNEVEGFILSGAQFYFSIMDQILSFMC